MRLWAVVIGKKPKSWPFVATKENSSLAVFEKKKEAEEFKELTLRLVDHKEVYVKRFRDE